eukprot:tig00020999_g16970.t1
MSGRKSAGRARKRARVDDPAAAPPPRPRTFDALPDAVMSDVFKALGLQASWPLRGVCRRWRQVVEEMELLSALFEHRKLRLGRGGSVSLRVELPAYAGDSPAAGAAVDAACRILRAIARSHSGPAQLRGVIVELMGGTGFHSPSRRTPLNMLRASLLGVLGALRPAADGAPSSLESLSIGFTMAKYSSCGDRFNWPRAAKLQAALAPFGRLRSLHIFFGPIDGGLGPDAAAAVAAACPLLRSLSIHPRDSSSSSSMPAALAALAPLAHLEHIALVGLPDREWEDRDVAGVVSALAGGAAGASLRSIEFAGDETRLYRHGEFPRTQDHAYAERQPAGFRISEADFLALGRMPRLESLKTLQLADSPPACLLALARAACQVDFEASIASGTDSDEALVALADLASRLPDSARLRMYLRSSGFGPGRLAEFLRSPGVQRCLVSLSLDAAWPLSAAEARAILALGSLERLAFSYASHWLPPLRPFEKRSYFISTLLLAKPLAPGRGPLLTLPARGRQVLRALAPHVALDLRLVHRPDEVARLFAKYFKPKPKRRGRRRRGEGEEEEEGGYELEDPGDPGACSWEKRLEAIRGLLAGRPAVSVTSRYS